MIETLGIVAISVLIILTFATLLPFIPTGILASITVLVYWWQTGYSEPNVIIVFSLVILGITVTITDFASGAVAGKIGGASNISVLVGTLIGTVLLFIVGPIGFLLGIALSVFIFSVYHEEDEVKIALKKSLYTVVGVLASKVVQILLLSIITISFGFFVLV